MVEKEMSMHQCSLVDNCFEEGHYMQGIAYLDQLRIMNHRPSPAHIRQLVYIALCPPSNLSERAKEKRREQPLGITSPSRPSRHGKGIQKQLLLPPPEASEAAWRLLHEFVDTVSPEALLRAIPCYPPSVAELASAPRAVDARMFDDVEVKEDLDSYIAKEATKLCELKDCWSMMKRNAVGSSMFASRTGDPFLDDGDDADDALSSSAIGNDSWPLLEWFVKLFERDQALVEQTKARYSIYMLSQIKPAPASIEASRTNVEVVLDITFTCYKQPSPSRKKLGRRLLGLLVSLGNSQSFSVTQLLGLLCTRLHSSSWETVSALLNDSPQTKSGLEFKAALCDKFLTQNLRGSAETASHQRAASSVRPQARKAKPTRDSVDEHSSKPVGDEPKQQKLHPWPLPSAAHILQLVKSLDVNLVRLTVLFHLVDAFGNLKGKIGTDNSDEQIWLETVRSSELEEDIKLKFSAPNLSGDDKIIIQGLLTSLLYSCSSWRQS